MKYFTPEWHRGEVEDEDDVAFESYQAHLVPLLPKWPFDVRMLANSISLNDGLIRKLYWNTDEATLHLRLRCGDLQVGYFDLDLHYSGVLLSPLDWGSLLLLKGDAKDEWRFSEALYDEVDEENGRFVHRILFLLNRRGRGRSPRRVNAYRRIKQPLRRAKMKFQYREVAIRFEKLRLATTPCKSRFDASE